MKLGLKLLLAPLATAAVMLAATAGSAVVAFQHYWRVVADADAQVTRFQALAARSDQITQAHAAVYRTVALMASLDEAQTKAARATLAQRLAGVKQAFADLASADAADAELGAIVAEAGQQIDAYVKHADMAIDLASVDPNTGIAALQSADAAFKAVSAQAARIVEHAKARSTALADVERQRARAVIGALTLLGVVVTALSLGLTVRLQRRLVADLDAARKAAQQVAAGDLQHTLATERSDELGELMRAVAAMQAALRTIVAEVRDSAHAFHGATGEMAQGNADLSQRTEESASSLQQTAASMTQLGGAVRQSADQAQAALRLADSAAQIAERGGTVVGDVVGTMNRIDEASRRIADIIGAIDGIAFQTNILALNAAVEAARAGEQGRGFAVVAGEVRALAQRSAAAAREIKSLIGASVEQVTSGTRLVADAGSTMADIVASVQRVAAVIGEITASARQQSVGLTEVGSAVAQLDTMTQQNAALVEQSASAAKSLEDHAARLAGSVASFKLPA